MGLSLFQPFQVSRAKTGRRIAHFRRCQRLRPMSALAGIASDTKSASRPFRQSRPAQRRHPTAVANAAVRPVKPDIRFEHAVFARKL